MAISVCTRLANFAISLLIPFNYELYFHIYRIYTLNFAINFSMLSMIPVSKVLTTRISAIISEWTCCRIRTTTDSTAAKALGIYIITIKWAREVWGQRINWNNFKRECQIRILRLTKIFETIYFCYVRLSIENRCKWHTKTARIRNIFFKKIFKFI